MKTNLRIAAAAAVLFAIGTAPAAPAPKPKSEPVGPITEEQLKKSENNLKQIALGWHNYHDTHGNLPSNEGAKQPRLSWRVQILPFIEEEELYKQFKLDEAWDSAHNKKLIDKMPKLYAPVRGKADAGMTYYQSLAGKNALLNPDRPLTLRGVPDGTSNTFMVAEAAKPVVWTKPEDLVFDGKDVPALGGLFDGRFTVAYCDGSVYRFRKTVGSDVLKLLIDPADGNVIPDLKNYLDVAEEK